MADDGFQSASLLPQDAALGALTKAQIVQAGHARECPSKGSTRFRGEPDDHHCEGGPFSVLEKQDP